MWSVEGVWIESGGHFHDFLRVPLKCLEGVEISCGSLEGVLSLMNGVCRVQPSG